MIVFYKKCLAIWVNKIELQNQIEINNFIVKQLKE